MSYGNRKHLAQGFSYFVGDHYRLRLFTYICAAKLCQTKQRHCYDKSINVSLYCLACLLALFTPSTYCVPIALLSQQAVSIILFAPRPNKKQGIKRQSP